jgi:DNA cross-link repair 1A protein
MECLDWPELYRYLEDDPLQASVHVVPMNWLSAEKLSELLNKYRPHYSHILAIKPTGWSYSPSNNNPKSPSSVKIKPIISCSSVSSLSFHTIDAGGSPIIRGKDRITLYSLPYSEHSSYEELVRFLNSLNIGKVIPTVKLEDDSLIKYFP